jgi:uncharacterized membrane protein
VNALTGHLGTKTHFSGYRVNQELTQAERLSRCFAVQQYNLRMEDLVNDISLGFLLLALVTLALIFRDAFRHLNADDQTTFRRWMGRKLSLRTRAIDNVWKEHTRCFPNSRKRFLFALFLVAFVVVGVGYQLWRIVGYR